MVRLALVSQNLVSQNLVSQNLVSALNFQKSGTEDQAQGNCDKKDNGDSGDFATHGFLTVLL